MKQNWIKHFYDILDFYFWEPQHLGKKKNPATKYHSWHDVLLHLKKSEVVLNQQLALFFEIIPNYISDNLLNKIVRGENQEKYTFESESTKHIIDGLGDFTQPDFLFEGEKGLLAIEMKIGAKSSLDQLMKYLFLFVLMEEKLKNAKNFKLIFLANGDFKNVWKEKFRNEKELKNAFRAYEIPQKTAKGGIEIRDYKEKIFGMLDKTEICFLNFEDLHDLLEEERVLLKKDDLLAQGWIKFIEGMQFELEDRKLSRIN